MIFCYGCKFSKEIDNPSNWREETICQRTGEKIPAYHPDKNCGDFVDRKSGMLNRVKIPVGKPQTLQLP